MWVVAGDVLRVNNFLPAAPTGLYIRVTTAWYTSASTHIMVHCVQFVTALVVYPWYTTSAGTLYHWYPQQIVEWSMGTLTFCTILRFTWNAVCPTQTTLGLKQPDSGFCKEDPITELQPVTRQISGPSSLIPGIGCTNKFICKIKRSVDIVAIDSI